jgi:hypothetical protein
MRAIVLKSRGSDWLVGSEREMAVASINVSSRE